MNDKKDRKFKVIENQEEQVKTPSVIRHTNPILKQALEFHQEKAGKFKVKDLFTK